MADECDFLMDELLPVGNAILQRQDGTYMPNSVPQPKDEPPPEPFAKRAHYIKGEDGQLIGGFDRDHYVDRMKMWKRNGELVETFISGCCEDWQPALTKIAEEEGLL